jgi:transcriptional regulator GlxA family with amidase domain
VIDILFVVLPDTLLLDLAGPAEAFRLANQALARYGLPPAFRMRFAGPQPEARSSVGLKLADLEPLPAALPSPTWVVLMGRPGRADEVLRTQPEWLTARDWLGRVVGPLLTGTETGADTAAAPTGHRLLTVCVGALLAADAGLLGGRTVTTHHELLADLAKLAPAAQVQHNRVFIDDGAILSSAGITAGIDLALHCIQQICGPAIAASVAQVMVVFSRRGSNDPQRSAILAGRRHLHPAVHRAQDAVCDNPGCAWTVQTLADAAHVSARHLARLFVEHAGVSPREYVEQVRVALATHAVARGVPVKQAAAAAGFGNDRQWRRARGRTALSANPG